jgi:hypothetical protein
MREYYNRYDRFIADGEHKIVPGIELPIKSTDKYISYKVGKTRLDKVSQQHYNSPFFGWLILQANPEFTGFEFNIPDGAVLTIPYPLLTSLQDYKNELDNHTFYYGK